MYSCSHCGAFIDDPDEIYCPECSAYFEPGELARRGAPEDEGEDDSGTMVYDELNEDDGDEDEF